MKTLTKLTRNLLLTLMLVFSFVFFGGVYLIKTTKSAFAYEYSSSSVSITNGDFNSVSTSSSTNNMPYDLNGRNWTVTGDAYVLKGVINTKDDTFRSNGNFGFSINPKTDETLDNSNDPYVLGFASKNEGWAKAVSSEIALTNGNYYALSVRAKANKGLGYFTLQNTNKVFENISDTSWRTYTFLVALDDIEGFKTNVILGFGGNSLTTTSGEVFFDYAYIEQISKVDYEETSESSYVKKISLLNDRIIRPAFDNSNFEEGISGFEISNSTLGDKNCEVGVFSKEAIDTKLKEKFSVTDGVSNAFINNDEKSLLFINSSNVATSVYTNEDNVLNVPMHSFYKLTILYKTGEVVGTGLNFTLSQVLESEPKTASLTNLNSSSGIDAYNKFQMATFYIKGDTRADNKVSLDITFGACTGYAIVDEIILTSLTGKEYTDASSSSSSTLDLTSFTSSTSIPNGMFEASNNESTSLTYPLAPSDWEYNGNYSKGSGIIRVNKEKFESDHVNYGSAKNPGVNNAYYGSSAQGVTNENVLMIRNNGLDDVYYRSASTSISANSTSDITLAKYEVGINTQDDSKAFIRLKDSNGNILALIDNISTNDNWKTYTIYVKNSMTDLTAYFEIGVKGNNKDSYAFFDIALKTSPAADLPLNTLISPTSTYVDLMEDSFYSHLNSESKIGKFYAPLNLSLYNSDNDDTSVEYGIKENFDKVRQDAKDSNILVVKNTVDSYQTLISNYTYSLKSGKYYEFSVYIKTDFENSLLNGEKFGANFEVAKLTSDGNIEEVKEEERNYFENISVNGTKDNGWVKYSIYIFSESDQNVKVLLGLGSEEYRTEGTAYFDDLYSKEITKEDYTAIKPNDTTIVTKVLPSENESSGSTPSTPSSSSTGSDINVFALASSILLVVALVIAIAGFTIRHLPKPKESTNVKEAEYNKTPSKVNAGEIRNDLRLQRENNLAKLNSELEKLNKEYETLKNEYEEKTKEDSETNKTLYAEYTKKTNKVLDRIDYVSSAIAYLKDEGNIKEDERREIRRRKIQNKKDFENLQKENKEDK